jgi:tetratricopeptide (TPR) repeat protein
VRASQTVVRVGDPIELDIVIRGGGRLEGVGLPDLTGPGGLPRGDFDVPAGKPTGQVIEDGKAKRFLVTVRLLRPVGQIPPIQFPFWNPARREYEVATSQAVALSVAGSRAVGAGDVVAGAPDQSGKARARATPEVAQGTGADLSPSAPDRTLRRPLTMASARPLVIALYGAPTLLFGFGLVRRWRRRRGAAGSAGRAARSDLDRALERAASAPAREAIPAIVGALRALLRAGGHQVSLADALIAELEDRAFDPTTAGAPLPAELRARVGEQAATWARTSRPSVPPAAGAVLVLFLLGSLVGRALAEPAADPLARARDAYQSALGEADRAARTRAFGRAATLYRALTAQWPDRPELLTDWGNAALGASDLGTAVLAYRRALRLDPGLERAQVNLAWARDQQPTWAAASDEGSPPRPTRSSSSCWSRSARGAARACAVGSRSCPRWSRSRCGARSPASATPRATRSWSPMAWCCAPPITPGRRRSSPSRSRPAPRRPSSRSARRGIGSPSPAARPAGCRREP